MVFPVVLGSGKRLFGETSDKKPLRLSLRDDRRRRRADPRLRARRLVSISSGSARSGFSAAERGHGSVYVPRFGAP